MNLALLLLLSLSVGLPYQCTAQTADRTSFVHRNWTAEDGLPQNSVTALARTHDGYLWVGMLQSLARFDGVRFTTFEAATTDGLNDDRIFDLLEDKSGTLWILPESGSLSFVLVASLLTPTCASYSIIIAIFKQR